MNESNTAFRHQPAPALAVAAVKIFAWSVSKILWFVSYRRRGNIPQNLPGGLIVAPNHQTYIDPVWVGLPIRRELRFMALDTTLDWFFIGKIMKYLGAFPVSHRHKNHRQPLKESLECLRRGETLVVFPEGGRAFSGGATSEFKSGAVKIALQAQVPILPVTIRGANRVWAQGWKYPKLFRKVEIIYHPLFKVTPPPPHVKPADHVRRLTAELQNIVESAL